MLALTWILLAFRNAFHKIEGTLRDTQILRTGIYLGIAALFYLPALVFILPAFYAYMLFARLSPRRSLLLLYGTLLPFLVAVTYFYTVDTYSGFIDQYLLAFNNLANRHYVSGLSLFVIMAVALVFFVLALYKLTQYRRFTIQQTQLQQVMFVNVIAALGFYPVGAGIGSVSPAIICTFAGVLYHSLFVNHSSCAVGRNCYRTFCGSATP